MHPELDVLLVQHVRGMQRVGVDVPLLAILGTESGHRAVTELGLLRAVRVSQRPAVELS